MSTLSTNICTVESREKNPDSDFLWIYKISGQELYIQTPVVFEIGEKCVVINVDSVLPPELDAYIFPEGNKVKSDHGRIRAVRIRKFISQGLILKPAELEAFLPGISELEVGTDVMEGLGIKKYQPPVHAMPSHMRPKNLAPHTITFKVYTDLDHFRKNPDVLQEGEEVVFLEKIHGSNARFGLLTRTTFTEEVVRNTLGNKVKKFLGLDKGWLCGGFFPLSFDLVERTEVERCLGSHRVQIHLKPIDWVGYFDENIWQKTADKYDLFSKLEEGEELFGEIFSGKVQKGYSYGVREGDYGFLAFDLIKDGSFVDYDDFVSICDTRGIPRVPELYRGPFNKEKVNEHVGGPSAFYNQQKVREGLVAKPVKERFNPRVGRVIFKVINPEYLLKDTTDWQ
jgi:RNA ligase (TIGR02306 family)